LRISDAECESVFMSIYIVNDPFNGSVM
jgi:hypothetical protein